MSDSDGSDSDSDGSHKKNKPSAEDDEWETSAPETNAQKRMREKQE